MKKKKKKSLLQPGSRRPRGHHFLVVWDMIYGLSISEISRKHKLSLVSIYKIRDKYSEWVENMCHIVDAEIAKHIAMKIVMGGEMYSQEQAGELEELENEIDGE